MCICMIPFWPKPLKENENQKNAEEIDLLGMRQQSTENYSF